LHAVSVTAEDDQSWPRVGSTRGVAYVVLNLLVYFVIVFDFLYGLLLVLIQSLLRQGAW